MNNPTPVLSADKLYAAYDRFVCTECAGMTAKYTGVTIGGYRLTVVAAADVVEWDGYDLGPLTCQCRRLEAVLHEEQLQIRPPAALTTRCPGCGCPVTDETTCAGDHTDSCTLVMCQCEHADHEPPAAAHPYLRVRAGTRRAQHVGPVCDECADSHLADYILDAETHS